jgi:hypothetical protein
LERRETEGEGVTTVGLNVVHNAGKGLARRDAFGEPLRRDSMEVIKLTKPRCFKSPLATPSLTFSGSRLNSTLLDVLTFSSPSLPPSFCFESAGFDAVTTAETHCPGLKREGSPGRDDVELGSSSSSDSS